MGSSFSVTLRIWIVTHWPFMHCHTLTLRRIVSFDGAGRRCAWPENHEANLAIKMQDQGREQSVVVAAPVAVKLGSERSSVDVRAVGSFNAF